MNNQEKTSQERRLEREQSRFKKQVTKDIERSQGKRLSQNVIRKLINNDTSRWAKAILDQKLSQTYSANNIRQPTLSIPNIFSSIDITAKGSTSVLPAEPASSNTSSEQRLRFGGKLGDILYWDPSADDDGDWVVLPAAQSGGLHVLTIQGGSLAWTQTESC